MTIFLRSLRSSIRLRYGPAADARLAVQPLFRVMNLVSRVGFWPAVPHLGLGPGDGSMVQTAGSKKGLARIVILLGLILAAVSGPAFADPCADGCRAQHNACRMNTKLLYSPRCDSSLQSCLSGCFAQDRVRGREREGHAPKEFRGAPEFRGPPEFRLPKFQGRSDHR